MKAFVIQPETMAYLGTKWGMKAGVLSPLYNDKLGAGSDKDISRLQNEKVLTSDLEPAKGYEDCFQVLKNAKYRLVVSLTGRGADFEYHVYESESGKSIGVLATAEGLKIGEVNENGDFEDVLKQYTGFSFIKSSHFEMDVERKHVQGLVAVMDSVRASKLKSFYETSSNKTAVETSDIERALNHSKSNGEYIGLYANALCGESSLSLDESLRDLESKSILSSSGGGWSLKSEIEQAVSTWLIMDNFIQLSAVRKGKSGTADHLNVWILQFGMHDLLVLECKEKIFSLKTITSGEVYGLMNDMYSVSKMFSSIPERAGTQEPVKSQVPTTSQDQSGDACSECGKSLKPGAKFCSSCGAKVVEKPKKKFCTSCGKEVEGKAKFCSGCGQKLE